MLCLLDFQFHETRFSTQLLQAVHCSGKFREHCGSTVISGRLPAVVYFCRKGKKCSTDYPHWPVTRTPKPKKIMLLYYRDKNSQTWSNEYCMGLNPVEAPKTFFGLNCDCLNRKHDCDDHTLISFHVSVYKAEDRSHFLLRINH